MPKIEIPFLKIEINRNIVANNRNTVAKTGPII